MNIVEIKKETEQQAPSLSSVEVKQLWEKIAEKPLDKFSEQVNRIDMKALRKSFIENLFWKEHYDKAEKLLTEQNFSFTPEQEALFQKTGIELSKRYNFEGKNPDNPDFQQRMKESGAWKTAEQLLLEEKFTTTPEQDRIILSIKKQLAQAPSSWDLQEKTKDESSKTITQEQVSETNEQISNTMTQEQVPETKSTTPQTSSEEKSETHEQKAELTLDQKAQEVTKCLEELSKTVKPDEQGRILLTTEQLNEFDRIDSLLAQPQQSITMAPISERTLLVQDKKARKEVIKSLNKEIRAEKKAKADLKKIADLEEKLAQAKNSNNYQYQKASVLEQINQALETGVYINTPIAFLEQNPLIIDLYKNKNKIKSEVKTMLSYQGKPVEIYNQALLQKDFHKNFDPVNTYVQTCGGYANIAEKALHENTKMSPWQARNAVNTLTTIGMIGAAILVGKRLFTNKEWKFGFSLGKIATAIGLPMLANYASQAATGKWLLENINTFRRTGVAPWNSKAFDQATGIEKIAVNQSMLQFVLLGVPFSALAQCSSPAMGNITHIDTGKLKDYYTWELEKAKANQDRKTESILKSQLAALESIINNQGNEKRFQQEIEKMQLKAEDLANPSSAQNNLNERLYQDSEAFKQLENYCTQYQLTVNEEKRQELEQRIFTSKQLSESDFKKMQEEGLLLPHDVTFQSIKKLEVPDTEKLTLYNTYKTMAGKANIEKLNLEVNDTESIILKAYGQEIKLNMKQKRLEGFVDATGNKIPIGSAEELLHIGLLVSMLKNDHNTRWETPDLQKQNDENYPFSLSSTRYDRIFQNIIFKHNNGTEITILSDRIPILSTMDRKFPTIEAEQNRRFFVKYLNALWKQEHPTQ